MSQHQLVSFGRIDQTADAKYFIQFLDTASAEASFQAYKKRTAELLEPAPGKVLLEVACGTGDDARALAQRVVPGGRVVALDNSAAMVAEARQRTAATELPIEFHVGDAMNLPFADATFAGVRCDRSFMHVPDPRRVLAEMVRVAWPGAPVVVYEVDFETVTIDAPDRALARQVVNAWTDGFRNGWLGRYIPGLFHEAGLADVRIEPHVLRLNEALVREVVGPKTVARAQDTGVLTPDQAAVWLAYLDGALAFGRFFSTLTGFLVAGRKSG